MGAAAMKMAGVEISPATVREIAEMSGGRPTRTAAGWLKTYKRNTYLRQPIHRLAEDVSAVKFRLYRKLGEGDGGRIEREAVTSHPFLDLWNNPHPMMTGHEYRRLGVMWLETTGRWATWIQQRDGRGRPTMLTAIVPTDVLQVPTIEKPRWRFRYQKTVRECGVQDMIWITYLDVEDPFGMGASPCDAIVSEVLQTELANQWNTNHFKKGAHPGKIVAVPGLNSAQGKAIEADFNARFSGIENAHKTFFVGSAPEVRAGVTISDLMKSHKEMEYNEGLNRLREVIASNWNESLELLGVLGNSNRSAGDNARRFHQAQNVFPRASFLNEQFELQLLGEFREPELLLDFDNPVEESKDFELAQANDGVSRGCITVNEWRRRNGMDSLGPVGEVLLVPVNLAVVPKSASLEDLMAAIVAHHAAQSTPPQPSQQPAAEPVSLALQLNGKAVSLQ